MKSAVTVSLVPEARGGPFVFWDDLPAAARTAAALGFDAIEVFPPSASALAGVPAVLRDTGLSLAAVGTGAGWVVQKLTLTHADAAVRARALAFVKEIVSAAADLGAPAILGSMQGRWGDGLSKADALGYLKDAVRDLSDHAGRRGTVFLVEPLNRYESNLLNTLADGVELFTACGASHARLLADLYHMNIEEVDLAAAVAGAGPAVGHVHFADSNRRAVGGGHTDVRPVVAELMAAGYAGYLSAEVLPLPDSVAAATATMTAFRSALDGLRMG